MESINLVIRPSVFSDCKQFAKWETKFAVTEFFSINCDRDYEEVVLEFVERNADKTKLQFTICDKQGNLLGRVYISNISQVNDSLDITRIYIGDPQNRGKGYGKEAIKLLLDYCFINLHMERVSLDYFEGNKVASALYESMGFKHEGLARNACKKDGKYYDLHLMSILRSEYYGKLHSGQ
ncbi:MAG: GNAT family N-acetyltransferase [Eubacteriales bacterium]